MSDLLELLASWGLAGVFFVATLDSAGAPLPAGVDALLVAVAAVSPPKAYFAALLAVGGSAIGNLFLFSLARRGGEAYLKRHTVSQRGRKLRAWFQHYGLIAIFIPTFVPVVPLPLKVFVLSAGALGVKTRAFLLAILAGRIPRFLAMAYLGAQLGENSIEWLQDHGWHLTAMAVALFVFLVALVKFADYRRKAAAGRAAAEMG